MEASLLGGGLNPVSGFCFPLFSRVLPGRISTGVETCGSGRKQKCGLLWSIYVQNFLSVLIIVCLSAGDVKKCDHLRHDGSVRLDFMRGWLRLCQAHGGCGLPVRARQSGVFDLFDKLALNSSAGGRSSYEPPQDCFQDRLLLRGFRHPVRKKGLNACSGGHGPSI
jgi:hypothetical protein